MKRLLLAFVALLLVGCGTAATARPHPLVGDVLTATMGPLFPTAASGSFSNPQNVTASDGAFASAFVAGDLTVSGFGFSVPPGATITGVTVEVQALGQDTGREALQTVTLSTGASDATSTTLPTTLTWLGRTLSTSPTPAQVNDPAFAVALHVGYVGPNGSNSGAQIDAVRVSIAYQPAPATPAPTVASPTVAPTDTPSPTATATETATPIPTDTPASSPTVTLATDTNGTVILLDALQRQLDAIRVFEVDAGSAAPQLVGEPPIDTLSASMETLIQLEIEVAAREPNIAAQVLATQRALIADWLAAYPDVTASLSGRALAWLDDNGLAP